MAPKREKGTSMSLADFTKSFGSEGASTPSSSWADDDLVLPSAPTGMPAGPSRGFAGPAVVDEASLPREPPYVAFVGNLSYDADEYALRTFFAGATSVRFPPPGAQGPRGFAYVEFSSVDSLRAALQRSGEPLGGRPCRVDVSTSGSAGRRDGPPPGIVGGNWREGAGRVVETSGAFGSRPSGFTPRAPESESTSASRIAALTARDRAESGGPQSRSGGFVSRAHSGPREPREPLAPPRAITRPTSAEHVVPVPARASGFTGGAQRKPEPVPVRTDWRAGKVVDAPAPVMAKPVKAEGKAASSKFAPPPAAKTGNWRARPAPGSSDA